MAKYFSFYKLATIKTMNGRLSAVGRDHRKSKEPKTYLCGAFSVA